MLKKQSAGVCGFAGALLVLRLGMSGHCGVQTYPAHVGEHRVWQACHGNRKMKP
jgi:hypothetical protein